MLQQTQAGRVVEKYKAFIRLFPTPKHLARAPLHKVLKAWQGLGYNRRAQTLRETAMIVQEKYRGKIPADPAVLATLPGIGPYTAAAIMVFAFNKTLPMIETNVRSVFIHHFFKRAKNVSDTKLIPLIEQTIDNNNPRQWFSALMDYGTHLKTIHPNPSRQSAHYTKQSRFEGSHRQLRGAILITLLKKPLLTKMQLSKLIQSKTNTLEQALKELRGEGIINKKGARFVIT
jgi:A/G-specific adenine glycosylase